MSTLRRETDEEVEADHYDKYVVFRAPPGLPEMDTALEPGTYFVLRDTDLLSHALLWNYVQLIQTTREISRSVPEMLTSEEAQALDAIEDYVQDLAVKWQRSRKGTLPT